MSARMRSEARREQLLDTCERIVDVAGFSAATLDRVAEEAGVTRTVLYQHFGGLEGLFDALVDRAAARAAQTLANAGAWDEGAPVEVMKAVLTAVDADPATWRLFLVIPPAGPASLVDALEAGRKALRTRVAEGFATGGGADDPELAARLVQAVADEIVRLRLADPSLYDHDRLLTRYETIVRALSRSGSRQS